MGDLDKLLVAKGFKKLSKVQKIDQSGHTASRSLPLWKGRVIHLSVWHKRRKRPIQKNKTKLNSISRHFFILSRTLDASIIPGRSNATYNANLYRRK